MVMRGSPFGPTRVPAMAWSPPRTVTRLTYSSLLAVDDDDTSTPLLLGDLRRVHVADTGWSDTAPNTPLSTDSVRMRVS